MPDPSLSAAIAEAYASAPTDLIIYHTLELYHPAFTVPVRVVRDHVALDARLEAGAPRDAGDVVTFTAYAFDIIPPDQTADALPQCVIEIDNVGQEILAQIDAATSQPESIEVIYRQYLSDALNDGPENDPPLTLHLISLSADPMRIRATAGFRNLMDRAFPLRTYDLERFPGLTP